MVELPGLYSSDAGLTYQMPYHLHILNIYLNRNIAPKTKNVTVCN